MNTFEAFSTAGTTLCNITISNTKLILVFKTSIENVDLALVHSFPDVFCNEGELVTGENFL